MKAASWIGGVNVQDNEARFVSSKLQDDSSQGVNGPLEDLLSPITRGSYSVDAVLCKADVCSIQSKYCHWLRTYADFELASCTARIGSES